MFTGTMAHRLRRIALTTGAVAATLAAPAIGGLASAAPAEAASANLFASVSLSGTVVAGNGVTGVTHIGTGQYEVTFSSDVSSCAYVATTINAYSQALQIFTAGGHLSADGVYVETKNQGGGLSSGIPFHLAVVCPTAANVRTAVVGSTGIISRGSSLTSSFSSGTGLYTVATNEAVTSCATVATRGSVNTAVPFDPATVEAVPGPADNTIGFQVRSLLFFGGNLENESFHTAIVC
jgi:hypothetical protein